MLLLFPPSHRACAPAPRATPTRISRRSSNARRSEQCPGRSANWATNENSDDEDRELELLGPLRPVRRTRAHGGDVLLVRDLPG